MAEAPATTKHHVKNLAAITGCTCGHVTNDVLVNCPEHGGFWSHACKACWDHYEKLVPKRRKDEKRGTPITQA